MAVDHTAILSLSAFYAAAWKNGAYPAIAKDQVWMMYRPHTTSASPTNDPFNQAPSNIGYVSAVCGTALTLDFGQGVRPSTPSCPSNRDALRRVLCHPTGSCGHQPVLGPLASRLDAVRDDLPKRSDCRCRHRPRGLHRPTSGLQLQ